MKSILIKLLAFSLIAQPLAANPFIMQGIKNPQTIALVRATLNAHKSNAGILSKNLQKRNFTDGMPGGDPISETVFSPSNNGSHSSGGGTSALQAVRNILALAGFGIKFFKDRKDSKEKKLAEEAARVASTVQAEQGIVYGFDKLRDGVQMYSPPSRIPDMSAISAPMTGVAGGVATQTASDALRATGDMGIAERVVDVYESTWDWIVDGTKSAKDALADRAKEAGKALVDGAKDAGGAVLDAVKENPGVAGLTALVLLGAASYYYFFSSSSTSTSTASSPQLEPQSTPASGCNPPAGIEKPAQSGCGAPAINSGSTQGGSTIRNPILEKSAAAGCEYPIEKSADISTMEKNKNQTKVEEKNSENDERLHGAQAPGKPTEGDGFIPPKNWDGRKVRHPETGQVGYPDKDGNVWVPTGPGSLAHGGPHWDVVSKDGRRNKNVLPGGRIRGEK